MCFYYDGYPECSRTIMRVARKPHLCGGCRELIAKGERYKFSSGIFYGDPFVEKECARCTIDKRRIHDAEVAAGCAENEAWPALDDLEEALSDRGMERTPKGSSPEPAP